MHRITSAAKKHETKLAEQFRYFRQEFLDAASSLGVPVPLNMVEDKSGKLFTFIEQRGYHYIFQIMHSHPESPHLLRCSLSLLIITILILKSKSNKSSSQQKQNTAQAWITLLADNVSSWALTSLQAISDGGSVAICVNLLRHEHSEGVQDLVLNLLAQLVGITEEATNQMLLFPSVRSRPDHFDEEESRVSRSSKDDSRVKITGSRSISPKLLQKSSSFKYEENYTCLAQMFAVIVRHRNRYMVMTGCADVVLNMISTAQKAYSQQNVAILCEGIAKTTIRRQENALNDSKFNKTQAANLKRKILSSIQVEEPKTLKDRDDGQPEYAGEWAVLKLFLRFLKRFMRYVGNPENLHRSYSDDEVVPLSATAAAPINHKETFEKAHARVLFATCELINNSQLVAEFIVRLSGAKRILSIAFAAQRGHCTPELTRAISNCNFILDSAQYRINNSNRRPIYDHNLQSDSRHPHQKRDVWVLLRRMLSAEKLKQITPLHVIETRSIIDSIGTHSMPSKKCSVSTASTHSKLTAHSQSISNEYPKPHHKIVSHSETVPTVKVRKSDVPVVSNVRPGTAPKRNTDDGILRPRTASSLHQDLFSAMPAKPIIPPLLTTEGIINHGVDHLNDGGIDDIEDSFKRSLSIQTSVVEDAHRTGYFQNGRHSHTMTERARRIYVPMSPSNSNLSPKRDGNSIRTPKTSRSPNSPPRSPPRRIPSIDEDLYDREVMRNPKPKVSGMLLDGLGGFEGSDFLNSEWAESVLPIKDSKLRVGSTHVLQSMDIIFP